MQHLASAVTIAVLGMLTLCFRHWPDMSRDEDRGPLQALTQLPLLSLKRVVGAWLAGIPLLMLAMSCAWQLLHAARLRSCLLTVSAVVQAGWCWLRWLLQLASSFSGSSSPERPFSSGLQARNADPQPSSRAAGLPK